MSEKSTSSNQIPVLSDAPAKRDMLDYGVYRDALASILEDPATETPLTIGIFGDWGSGKTTLLEMVKDKLDKGNTKTLWANVWQFERQEEIWAAFLQALLLKVKTEMPWYKQLLFNAGLLRRRTDWQRLSRKFPELLARIAIVVVPLFFSTSDLLFPGQPLQAPSEVAARGAGTLVSVVLGWYLLLQPYVQAVRQRVKVDLTGVVEASPLSKRVSDLEQYKTYFEYLIMSFAGEKGRVVIFVDDLDRCSSEQVVQILDAIKLLLELPTGVYVLGLDRGVVEQAVTTKFAEFEERTLQAREYLDKIIGLPFDLPQLSSQQMEVFVRDLCANLPPEAERSTQVFALGQEPNPRKVKRTINMFLFMWALAQGRESLKDVIKPIRLAKIVVIQHSYRDLYQRLTLFPQYLGELEAYLRQREEELGPAGNSPIEEKDHVEETSPDPPKHLMPFVNNSNLMSLLTLHPGRDAQSKDANFTVWEDEEYKPIANDQIRAYIKLTYSTSHDQRRIRRTSSGLGATREVTENFVNRDAEREIFLQALEEDTSEASVILISEDGGTGKTTLLKRYQYECAWLHTPPIPAVYLDGSLFEDGLAFMNAVRSELFSVMESLALTTPRDLDEYNKAQRTILATIDPNEFGVDVVHLRFGFAPEAGLSSEIAGGWREQVTRAFINDLSTLTSSTKTVLLIDNWERVRPNVSEWITTRFLSAESRRDMQRLIVVIAGRQVPDIASARSISSLGQFTPAQVEALLELHLGKIEIPEEDKKALSEIAGNNPYRLIQLIQEFLELDKSS